MAKFVGGDAMVGYKFAHKFTDFASGATNTDQTKHGFVAQLAIKLESAYIVFDSAMTGAATNYPKFSLVNLGTGGAGTTEVAALSMSSTAVAAASGAPLAVTPSTTAANLLIAAGEALVVKVAQQASGKAYPISYIEAIFSFQ